MRFTDRVRLRLADFTTGRYGADFLNRFLCVAALVLMLLSTFVRNGSAVISSLLYLLAAALMVLCYIRMFSRNTGKRYAENVKYMKLRNRVTDWFSLRRERFCQRREYAFFRCPGCRSTMRVPRGKGRLRITCRKCGYTFERKT